jgi:hypothetical protein
LKLFQFMILLLFHIMDAERKKFEECNFLRFKKLKKSAEKPCILIRTCVYK